MQLGYKVLEADKAKLQAVIDVIDTAGKPMYEATGSEFNEFGGMYGKKRDGSPDRYATTILTFCDLSKRVADSEGYIFLPSTKCMLTKWGKVTVDLIYPYEAAEAAVQGLALSEYTAPEVPEL